MPVVQANFAAGLIGLAAIGVIARLEMNPRAERVVIVNGEVELDIELLDQPADVDGNGKELMDVNPRHAQAAQAADKIREVVVRMIGPVRLSGRTQCNEAVGAAVQHDMLGQIAEGAGDFLDVLLGAAAPMMGNVQQDGFRAGTRIRKGQGHWRRIRH